jgi:hypothetical protein
VQAASGVEHLAIIITSKRADRELDMLHNILPRRCISGGRLRLEHASYGVIQGERGPLDVRDRSGAPVGCKRVQELCWVGRQKDGCVTRIGLQRAKGS